jgi:ribosome-associated translation inhibitor RaiA
MDLRPPEQSEWSRRDLSLRLYFQKISEKDKKELKKYFDDKKLSRLTKLIQGKDLELAKLSFNAKYHQHNNIFLVRLRLRTVKKDIRSEEKGQALIEAFDLAFDKLISQLRKLKDIKHDK